MKNQSITALLNESKYAPVALKTALPLAISLAALCLQPSIAVAGSISFLDLTDTVSVILSQDLIDRGSTWTSAGEVATVILMPPSGGSGNTSFGNTTILGPLSGGDEGPSTVSDTITVVPTFNPNFTVQFFTVTFTSDADDGSALPNLGNTMRENGTLQEAITSKINWQNNAVADHVFFQSNITDVPEPSAAVLSLISLGLCGFTRLRARVSQR